MGVGKGKTTIYGVKLFTIAQLIEVQRVERGKEAPTINLKAQGKGRPSTKTLRRFGKWGVLDGANRDLERVMVGYRNALRAAAGDANGEGNRGVLGIKRVCESGWRRIPVSCGDQGRPSGPAGTTENSPALKCWAIVVRPLGRPVGAPLRLLVASIGCSPESCSASWSELDRFSSRTGD